MKFASSSVGMLNDSGCSYNVLCKLIATVDGPPEPTSLATQSALLTKLNLFVKFPLVDRGSAILNFYSSVNFRNNKAPSIRKVDYRFLIFFDAFYQSIMHIQRAIFGLHL